MPRSTDPRAGEGGLFRTAIIQQPQTKEPRFDVTVQLLLTAVLLFAAVQLIW
jgi:hypothetical protein